MTNCASQEIIFAPFAVLFPLTKGGAGGCPNPRSFSAVLFSPCSPWSSLLFFFAPFVLFCGNICF